MIVKSPWFCPRELGSSSTDKDTTIKLTKIIDERVKGKTISGVSCDFLETAADDLVIRFMFECNE